MYVPSRKGLAPPPLLEVVSTSSSQVALPVAGLDVDAMEATLEELRSMFTSDLKLELDEKEALCI